MPAGAKRQQSMQGEYDVILRRHCHCAGGVTVVVAVLGLALVVAA